jgi:transposase
LVSRKRSDAKAATLRGRGTLNPRPNGVEDPLFADSEFFDPRDLLQVKYEMLRRVEKDGASVASTAAGFGFSRPAFYQAQSALRSAGLAALLPQKRGPRAAHKLNTEIMHFIVQARAGNKSLGVAALLTLVQERFGLAVHRRSIERALGRLEKKPP